MLLHRRKLEKIIIMDTLVAPLLKEEDKTFIGDFLLEKLKNQDIFGDSIKGDTILLKAVVQRTFPGGTQNSIRAVGRLTWIFYGGRLESLQIRSWYGELFRDKIMKLQHHLDNLPELDRCDVLVLEP